MSEQAEELELLAIPEVEKNLVSFAALFVNFVLELVRWR
jgi:hypothetical protein